MNKSSKIYVAGHRGMVGSAIVRKLHTEGYHNLVLKTSVELDLRNQAAVEKFFEKAKQPGKLNNELGQDQLVIFLQ